VTVLHTTRRAQYVPFAPDIIGCNWSQKVHAYMIASNWPARARLEAADGCVVDLPLLFADQAEASDISDLGGYGHFRPRP
jgi:hypothetical protein